MTFRSKTTDLERELVLQQNELLRERTNHRTEHAGLFQRLRRCCICLRNSCKSQSACREEFAEWAEAKWNRAVETELDRRDPHRGPYIRVAEDGSWTPCTHDGASL